MMDELLFTPAALLDLLSNIDELRDVNVGVTETLDGKLQIQVGESTYEIDSRNAVDISVDEHVVSTIEDANQSAYEEMADSGDIDLSEPVESGIIKEIAKSLLLGGMIRLSAKLLK